MSVPTCACGYMMPGPGHARDCDLYDPAKVYLNPAKVVPPPDSVRDAKIAELRAEVERLRRERDSYEDELKRQCTLWSAEANGLRAEVERLRSEAAPTVEYGMRWMRRAEAAEALCRELTNLVTDPQLGLATWWEAVAAALAKVPR